MIIQLKSRFGLDLTSEAQVEAIAKEIVASPEPELEIDFCGCILDYPATSRIVDAAIKALADSPPPKVLILLFNIAFQEGMFIKWFFFGGEILPDSLINNGIDEIHQHISNKLQQMGIKIIIRSRAENTGECSDLYIYG